MSQPSFDLSGRIAVVTGAGTGLGRHFAGVLADNGASVVLAARRVDKLEAVAADISERGGEVLCVALDVTDSDSVAALFDEVTERIGVPDVIVNNAGISRDALLHRLPEADWDAVLDTNLKGVHLVASEAARRLIRAELPGSIVNIASVLGIGVTKGLGAYLAAKAGVIQLTRAAALEWARYGIRVNAIAPGYVVTDLNREYFHTDAGAAMIKRIPQRRVGEFDDLSGPILLLASEAGAYMTGSTLVVDGGHLLQPL